MSVVRRGLVAGLVFALVATILAGVAGAQRATVRASVATISSARCATNRAAGTIKFLSPFNYDASAGILDVYAAVKLGYFKDLCLDVTFNGGYNPNVYTDVSAGVGTISGEGSAADDLLAVAAGDRLTAISTFGDASDYVLLTRSGISNLKQLVGKTLGFHPPRLPVVLSEMLANAGVDVAKVHVVVDNSYVPSLLIHGPYQALQAYETNEPLTLRSEGYAKDFRIWTPAQFKVKGTFNVQVVNTAFLKAHPAAVSDFLRAELHAFDYCETHGATCVGWMKQAAGATYNLLQSEQEWADEWQLATKNTLPGEGIGVQSTAEWTPELRAVVSAKLVTKAPSLAIAMNTSIAAGLYRGKTLIWP